MIGDEKELIEARHRLVRTITAVAHSFDEFRYRQAVLLLYDTVARDSVPDDAPGLLARPDTWESRGAIHTYSDLGYATGWHAAERRVSHLPPVLGETPESVFVFVREWEDYVNRVCAVHLSTVQVEMLIRGGLSTTAAIEASLGRYLPRAGHDRVWPGWRPSKYGKVLLLSVDRSAADIDSSYVASVRRSLGLHGHAVTPFLARDLLVLSGIWVGHGDQFTVVWCRNQQDHNGSPEGGIELPRPLMEVMQHVGYRRVVDYLADILSELPLLRKTASEYLAPILAAKSDLAEVFASRVVPDRERASNLAVEVSRIAKNIDRSIATNFVSVSLGEGVRTFREVVPQAYRSSLLGRLVREVQNARERLRASLDLLGARERSAADLLRDLLAARVAASNLAIQNRIRRLTQLALILSFLSFLAVIVSDEQRSALLSTLGSLLKRLGL